jgi:hypothetical protein
VFPSDLQRAKIPPDQRLTLEVSTSHNPSQRYEGGRGAILTVKVTIKTGQSQANPLIMRAPEPVNDRMGMDFPTRNILR